MYIDLCSRRICQRTRDMDHRKLTTFLYRADGRHPLTRAGWSGACHVVAGTLRLASLFGQVHDISKVKTVIVEKDMNDSVAFQKDMPQASLQICKFHVLQAITREVRKTSCTQETREKVLPIFKTFVFAQNPERCNEALARLTNAASQSVLDYFNKNWLPCINVWCAVPTNRHVNLGNSTNNRMGSLNQKIKAVLNKNTNIAEVVSGILLLERGSCTIATHRSFTQGMKTVHTLNKDDQVVNEITSVLTQYAANVTCQEG